MTGTDARVALGALLRGARERADLTLTAAARLLTGDGADGTAAHSTIYRWECGQRAITNADLAEYLAAISATPDEVREAWRLHGVPDDVLAPADSAPGAA